jgi:hypothetical protein
LANGLPAAITGLTHPADTATNGRVERDNRDTFEPDAAGRSQRLVSR